MLKIALDLVLSRKKWLLIIVSSFAFMFAASFAILLASETIKSNLKEDAYQKYGEHTGVLMDTNVFKEELSKDVDDIGEYSISDKLLLENNKIITVGWFDEDALRLGRIQLLEGDYPKGENEIVIESSYKKLMEKQYGNEWSIGESKVLEFENGQKEVILVGIIEDYSANWSVPADVEIGKNDFPNILTISSEPNLHNYIFKMNGSKNYSINKSSNLTSEYGEGYINDRLLYTGLIDYDTVSTLAIIFQVVVLVMSIISMITIISFYNIKVLKKMAILKANGATSKSVFWILIYQYLLMLGVSLLLAIPLSLPLTKLIIVNTYNNGELANLNWPYIIGLQAIMLLMTGLFLTIKTIRDVKKMNNSSISSLLRGVKESLPITELNTNKFVYKQLYMQVITYKNLSILTTLSLCLSMLITTTSFFLQKETAGIWDDDADYVIVAQEIYLHKEIEHLNVLKEEGLTISTKDVERIEALPSVLHVDKTPFMVDVHPLIQTNSVTQPIENWISSHNPDKNTYMNKIIIPNVNYQIVDAKGFETLYPEGSFEDLKGKALLIVPNNSHASNERLIGEELDFVRKFNGESGMETQEWKYPVYDVLDEAQFSEDYQSFTIVLDNETASQNGIFRGYYDLSIFTKDDLTDSQTTELESMLSEMVSTTPGSLYQIVSDFIIEDTKISVFFGFLGQLSYVIAIVLAIISMLIMVFGKYNIQRFHWGTYMSMGMTKKQVVQYLGLEMLVYVSISAILSSLLFLAIALSHGYLYPISQYLISHLFSIAIVCILLLIGVYFIKLQIDKHSIYFLLRRED